MAESDVEDPHYLPRGGSGPSLMEVARVFVTLGVIGFGGPAAHVALMRREIVERRAWVDQDRFLAMFAACNLVPGPSSTELAVYLGYRRAGWRGMFVAGGSFILPAMLAMLALAWGYSRFGDTRAAAALLYGVRPVIVAVVTWALVSLARTGLRWPVPLVLAGAALVLTSAGIHPLIVLAASGLAGAVSRTRAVPPAGVVAAMPLSHVDLTTVPVAGRLLAIFFTFLKIGSLSFGSGYVLLAFLHADFVQNLHWLTDRQLIDAVALGQATPGPVFTTATFLGYLFGGVPGAVAATVAIFLPGVALVPFLDRVLSITRSRAWVQGGLEGVNAAVLGVIGAVTITLARQSLVDLPTVLVAGVSLLVLTRHPFLSPVLVVAGAAVGLALRLM